MNVIVTIPDNGNPREAIPVRAIPWVTAFRVSPDGVAGDLAKLSESSSSDRMPRLKNATAYCLIGSGKARAMAPKEWDTLVRALTAIHEDLKEIDLSRYEDRRQWEIRATEILPAGTFLWKDEFEQAYRRGYGSWPTPMVEGHEGDGEYISVEREGNREYTCYPIVPECLEATVLEGFSATGERSANRWAVLERPYYPVSRTVRYWCQIPDEKKLVLDRRTVLPLPDPDYPMVEVRTLLLTDAIETGQLRYEVAPDKKYKYSLGQGIQWRDRVLRREILKAWFERYRHERPPFLFWEVDIVEAIEKEDGIEPGALDRRASERATEPLFRHADSARGKPNPEKRKDKQTAKPQDRDPRTLEIVVDVRGEKDASEAYSRAQITGKGTSTWLLLVLFASRFGTVEKDGPEIKKLNYSKNRRNLGEALEAALGLRESPFISGDASTTKFKSICAENEGIDAMER